MGKMPSNNNIFTTFVPTQRSKGGRESNRKEKKKNVARVFFLFEQNISSENPARKF